MRVLVVGSGGREHALCWALSASPLLQKLWCAPGNPGTSQVAENVAIGALDTAALVAFAREQRVDLVVPGPEAPLVAGLADALGLEGIACCGPSAAAARLEGSKSFCKEICDAAGIPTALWERFDDAAAAREFVRRRGAPIVVKADGLAGGKGVVVAASVAEAEEAIAAIMEPSRHGAAGQSVVIEEFLVGEELSVFALCDGSAAIALGTAQDHKRVGDGDVGPNTGGMGAISPALALTPALEAAVLDRVIRPTVAALARQGTPFRGVLYAGVMLTEDGPKLLEYNVRFGDPECQALVLRLQSDLLAALLAACDGELGSFAVRWRPDASIAVVMAARGYPGEPVAGTEIRNLAAAEAVPGVTIFHAGTASDGGHLRAVGGRVLTVCARAADLREARDAAYRAIGLIDWPEGFCRGDIGARALTA
ncbi:MAG: phosphoribosylamine--glycine ligase [Acetobacteraceae bacterium]|nr:phosphoribosylamine--glycine ligase [Acetobacteraceae bacterium]